MVTRTIYAAAYLDDLVTKRITWNDHVQYLLAVLHHIKEAGLTAKGKTVSLALSILFLLGTE